MNDVVIIGGGVAGLSAGIHCAQLGMKPILIEGGTYPAHKVCGEFFSPEALPLLASWGIVPPVMIRRTHFFTENKNVSFNLPAPAGSMSRFFFDNRLMEIARERGVDVQTKTLVNAIHFVDGIYHLQLSSGKKIAAQSLVVGTGRVAHLLDIQEKETVQEPQFVGMKAHFRNPGIPGSEVFFFTFSGAYLGISVVENDVINVACLARKKVVDQLGSPEKYIQFLASLPQASLLKTVLDAGRLFPEWLKVQVPGFGMRNTPDLANVYFIGDAAGAIPPATGDGLAIALTTGQLVAKYVLAKDWKGFKSAWKKRYQPTFRWGLLLHRIMLSPILSKMAVTLGKTFPRVTRIIFTTTRVKI